MAHRPYPEVKRFSGPATDSQELLPLRSRGRATIRHLAVYLTT
jgi:hypothetical protein